MAQGRGSAVQVAAVLALLCLVHCKVAESATYVVGGSGGWTFNAVGWPNGKRFRAGDVLGERVPFNFERIINFSRCLYFLFCLGRNRN